MGVIHHAQYVYSLEQTRIEWLLNKGVSYSTLEKKGILHPVVDINIQYKKPFHIEEKYFTHLSID
mgnify:FL=1